MNQETFNAQSVPNATWVLPQRPSGGGSRPRFCDFDDSVIRLVKWNPSNHGATATYAELVASRVAQLFGAPVVRGSVVFVDQRLLPEDVADRIDQQFHLGFPFLPGSDFREPDYDGIDNNAALPAAAVQLAWLQIEDQRGHNQLLYKASQPMPGGSTRPLNQFVLIDQAFMCGGPDWNAVPLDTPDAAYRLPDHLLSRVSVESCESAIVEVESLDESQILACFGSYPEAWRLDPALIEKAATYVLQRRNYLRDILDKNFAP